MLSASGYLMKKGWTGTWRGEGKAGRLGEAGVFTLRGSLPNMEALEILRGVKKLLFLEKKGGKKS